MDDNTPAVDLVRAGMVKLAGQSTPYPKLPVAGPTTTDSAGGTYTPEAGLNPIKAVGGFFKDTAAAARGEGNYDALRANRAATFGSHGAGITAPPASLGLPQASYSNEGRVTNSDITTPEPGAKAAAPAVPAPTAEAALPKLSVSPAKSTDAYSGPAAGSFNPSVTPSLGVAGFQSQLNNIRALQDPIPNSTPSAPAVDQRLVDNQALFAKWDNEHKMSELTKEMTPNQKAAFASSQLQAQTTARGQDMSAATTTRGQDVSAATTTRGQDVSAGTARAGHQVQLAGQDKQLGLGMQQVGATLRGQTLQNELGQQQVGATLNGQNLHHEAALAGVKAQLYGTDTNAAVQREGHAAHRDIAGIQADTQSKVAQQQREYEALKASITSRPGAISKTAASGMLVPQKRKDGTIEYVPVK